MKQSLFLEFARGQLDQVLQTIEKKGAQYSGTNDALVTYRKAAHYLGNVSPQDIVLSRIVEKMERLRNEASSGRPLSHDALLDLIGHSLFVLAFEFEQKSLDTSTRMWDNTNVANEKSNNLMAPAHHL